MCVYIYIYTHIWSPQEPHLYFVCLCGHRLQDLFCDIYIYVSIYGPGNRVQASKNHGPRELLVFYPQKTGMLPQQWRIVWNNWSKVGVIALTVSNKNWGPL